jgi:uncharacterized protein (TIGR03437 family)
MRIFLSVLVAGGLVAAAHAQTASQMPQYSAETVVSYASLEPGPVAPNSLVTIFGRNLAWSTQYRTDRDLAGGSLPLILPGTGVTVTVNGMLAPIELVSPEQVIFLMPPGLRGRRADVQLVHSGRAGPEVRLELASLAPSLYLWEHGVVLARDAESHEWIEPGAPAVPGQAVILYATGLGQTDPEMKYREAPAEWRQIEAREEFAVWLNDERVADEEIAYVGVMPMYPGIYEIHLRLPEVLPSNPVVRVQVGEAVSPQEVRLALAGIDEEHDPEPAPDPEEEEEEEEGE